MAWSWTYEDADGKPVRPGVGESASFPTQADAETWLGEEWRGLAAAGVKAVTLYEDERVVYGPMSLDPAG